MQTYAQKIHAFKANEVRRKQKLNHEDENYWSSETPPIPRYTREKVKWMSELLTGNK